MLKFKNFPGAMPPNTMLGKATAPLAKPNPLGTLALRASAPRSGSISIVPPCLLDVDATSPLVVPGVTDV